MNQQDKRWNYLTVGNVVLLKGFVIFSKKSRCIIRGKKGIFECYFEDEYKAEDIPRKGKVCHFLGNLVSYNAGTRYRIFGTRIIDRKIYLQLTRLIKKAVEVK